MTPNPTHEWIRPLRLAANDFLEVLVDEFSIQRHRNDDGFSMNLEFQPESKSLWHRRGKDEVRGRLGDEFPARQMKHAEELEAFFFGGEGTEFRFHDPEFPFRFCSGGALPIITVNGKRYYRLHWRDIHPVGWNITNGGSDSIAEMLDPARIIRRELCEEMIVFDFNREAPSRLVLGGEGMAADAFPSAAWRKWHQRLMAQDMDLPAMRNTPLPCGWLHGSDGLTVEYAGPGESGYGPHHSDGLFLNINAEDFGIEVDRVVSIELPDTAVICDGELLSEKLLNSPVGLFDVKEMHAAIRRGEREFRPSILFFGARKHDPANLDRVLKDFLREKERNGLLPQVEKDHLAEAGEYRLDLCPAARNIIRRCMGRAESQGAPAGSPPPEGIDVFISFASEDQELAQEIRDWLEASGRRPVFFSPESIRQSDFTNSILTALEQARNLIVVGSRIDHLHKNWVNYEYTAFFHRVMRDGKENRQIFTIVPGLPEKAWPPAPLCDFQYFKSPRESLSGDLARLLESLR